MSQDESNVSVAESPSSAFVQAIGATVSAHRLYPPEHPSCLVALENLVTALEPLFSEKGKVCLENREDGVYVNDELMERPSGLLLWLSDQLRRRLIKAVIITPELEPTELSALCGMLSASARQTDVDQLRERLKGVTSAHVDVVELEYSTQAATGKPDKALVQEAWRLAMGQTTGTVIQPSEAKVMTDRLEKLSELHGKDDPVEETDLLALLAECSADRFGEGLPDDSKRMKLLLGHVLSVLHRHLQEGFQEPSTFRRRQMLGTMAQHILNRTPGLISSIAESAGPATPQVQARTRGRNPGEVLQNLFMRTPEENRPVECLVETTDTKAPPARQGKAPDPINATALIEQIPTTEAVSQSLPNEIEVAEVMDTFIEFLVGWVMEAEAAIQSEAAGDYLHEMIAGEVNHPSHSLAPQMLKLLDGTAADGLTIELRRKLFAGADIRSLLQYLLGELTTREDRVRSLRTAWKVLGDQVLQETIRCYVDEEDEAVRQDVATLAADALSAELAPMLARSDGKGGERLVALTMTVVDRLEPMEQAQLLRPFLAGLKEEAPLLLTVRVARIPSTVALQTLRDWIDSVNAETRQAFAAAFLSQKDIADLEVTADAAAGRGAWQKMTPERERAIRALVSAQTLRAREVLSEAARGAVWSFSSSKRALGRLARKTLEQMSDSHSSSTGRS